MTQIGNCIALPLGTDRLPCTSCPAWLPAVTALLLLLMGGCTLSRPSCQLSPGPHSVCTHSQHGSSQFSGFVGCSANVCQLGSSGGCPYYLLHQALPQLSSLLLELQQAVLLDTLLGGLVRAVELRLWKSWHVQGDLKASA